MMFDVMKLRAQASFREVETARDFVFKIANPGGVSQPVLSLFKEAQTRGGVEDLLVQMSRRIAGDADVVHVLDAYAGFGETVTDRLLGETGAVLDAIETLFFDRGDQSAVFDDGR